MTFLPNPFVFLIAIGIDLFVGEYPALFHPVVWMGRIVKYFDVDSKRESVRFFWGIMLLIVDVGIWFSVGSFATMIPGIAGIFIQAFLLKSTFSIRSLYFHVKRCGVEDEDKMRHNVSMIVSRNTANLDKWHLLSAALESLSENTSDSVTGPIFYYALFGLPGAFVYRTVNTLDAMIGYHNERFEWFGKAAARTDDALNFIPSRLTATFFAIFSPKKVFRSIFKYGPLKINGTYPMSAFSGLLGVKFEKIGYYAFDGREPVVEDIKRGLKFYVMAISVILSTFFLFIMVR